MQRRAGLAEQSRPEVSLHTGNSFSDAWSEIIRPWFQSLALAASGSPDVDIVVTPLPSGSYAIKRLLLEARISFLGIRFMFPADLRELLARKVDGFLARPEHLRLLLSIAAEQAMELPEDP